MRLPPGGLTRSTFVPIHGGGDGAWSWHLVADAFRSLGHDAVLIDPPSGDPSSGLWDYAEGVIDAVEGRQHPIVVAHSFGGFTAPLVFSRLPVDALVFVAGMIPAPGEAPAEWWTNTGQTDAHKELGEEGDDMTTYYHDVPPDLAAEALRRALDYPSERAYSEPWPLAAMPAVRTHFLLCQDDRLLPAAWLRGLVRERLGITPDEIEGGHCPNLARPAELARRLSAYAMESAP